MAIKFDTIDGVPSWAVCGFEYGDWSGVEDSDQAAAERWLDRLASEGLRLVCPVDAEAAGFDPSPRFGLACDTVSYYVELTAAARAVRAFVRSSRAYRLGDFDRLAAARIWNGGRGRLAFVRVVPNCDDGNGGGRVYVNMSVYRKVDGGRVSALLAALVAADRVGSRWRVVPVFLGYPAFYNVRTLGPSGCMTPAPRELVAKLCAAVGVERVEAVPVDCGRKIEEGGTL